MQKSSKPVKKNLKEYFLVFRSQVGDDQAFGELYDLFRGRTQRLLYSFVKSDLAEDLNQEVWLTVYKRIARLDDPKRFRTWLFQITRNRAMDYLRSDKRFSDFKDLMGHESEAKSVPETETFQVENYELLEGALDSLSPKLREVLVLNYYEGMDHEEMSLITGISIGTIKSRLHNAREKIKAFIKTKK